MINLTSKIQMTYNSGFIVIKLVKTKEDGSEYPSSGLTYLKPEQARNGILKHTGAFLPVEQIKRAKADLIRQDAIESGVARKEAALAKLAKAEG